MYMQTHLHTIVKSTFEGGTREEYVIHYFETSKRFFEDIVNEGLNETALEILKFIRTSLDIIGRDITYISDDIKKRCREIYEECEMISQNR